MVELRRRKLKSWVRIRKILDTGHITLYCKRLMHLKLQNFKFHLATTVQLNKVLLRRQRHRQLVGGSQDRSHGLAEALGRLHRQEPEGLGRHRGLEQAAEGEPHRLGRHPQAAGQVDITCLSFQILIIVSRVRSNVLTVMCSN